MEETTYEPEEIDLRAYWATLRKRWVTIAVTLAVVVIIAMALTFLQKPMYQATAKVLAKGDRNSSSDILTSTIPALGAFADQRDVQTQVEIIKSWPLLKAAAERTGLKVSDPDAIPVKVDGGKDSNIMTITTSSTDPQTAMKLANNVAKAYILQNLDNNRLSARSGRLFLEKQQKKLQDDLRDAAIRLRNYEEQTGAVGLDTATDSIVKALTDAETALTAAKTDRATAIVRRDQIRAALGRTKDTIVASTTIERNPSIMKLQDQISDLLVQRAGLLKDYAPTSRKVSALDAQITLTRSQERSLVADIIGQKQLAANPVYQTVLGSLITAEGDALAAAARVNGAERSVAEQHEKLSALPEQQYRLAQLQRDVQIAEKTYLAVQDRYQQLRIAEESTLANAQLIEPALMPKAPVSPKKKLNLVLAILVGLMLGIGLAALQEALDDTISTPDDIERELALPLLGVVGDIEDPEDRAIIRAGNFSGVAEAFRLIRSNIKFMAVDTSLRTIMVTSASKGEGKSTTAANLAVALAQDGKKVVLLDADLRRPNVHKQFGIPNGNGLTNAIVAGMPLSEVERDVDVENLRVITAGPIPPNPAELLDSARFARLIEELRTTSDMVIFDAPPVLGVADASILGGRADGVVMVVAAGDVERSAARRTLQMLQQARANVLGVVLNKLNRRKGAYYDYYYYYHYYSDDTASTNGNGAGSSRSKRRSSSASRGSRGN